MTEKPLAGRVIALSVGNSRDLARLGYGPEHLDEAALRIVRSLLQLGAKLAFGGPIRPGGFSRRFEELVQSERSNDREDEFDPKLLIYQPWPRDAEVTAEVVARAVGIVRYFPLGLALGPNQRAHPATPNATSPQIAWQAARAFSCMRLAVTNGGAKGFDGGMSPPSDARIVLGGQREEFNGAMAGIVEEALYTLEARKPLYIVGGFGGGARLLADAILNDTPPPELSLDRLARESAKIRIMREGFEKYDAPGILSKLYERLANVLAATRADFPSSLSNGLSSAENRCLMTSEDLPEILALLRNGLTAALRAKARAGQGS